MNFLAHLHLSGSDREILVGNLMGDFVKGRLAGRFSPGITRGIELHRRIDSFASRNSIFSASKRRIDDSFGHYRGVLVDLFYDHFLAAEWDEYSDVPYPQFIESAYSTLRDHEAVLPERLLRVLPAMFGDWLPSYREVSGIQAVLRRMSARIIRPNPLSSGIGELRRNYHPLREDFHRFFPELEEYAERFREEG
ncbi:MAG: hypothetical protein FD174_2333 [Geobacteraceae bacterium]|nr:MAG: hypothetical protein FD174_2333 [Geobacteraceae bacterium]